MSTTPLLYHHLTGVHLLVTVGIFSRATCTRSRGRLGSLKAVLPHHKVCLGQLALAGNLAPTEWQSALLCFALFTLHGSETDVVWCGGSGGGSVGRLLWARVQHPAASDIGACRVVSGTAAGTACGVRWLR